ncbi:MAG: potassium channel family protein [Rhizomicrobium sp.]
MPTLVMVAFAGYVVSYPVNNAHLTSGAWLAVAVICQLGVILSAFEGVCAYIIVGSFRRYYHVGLRLHDDKVADAEDTMYEVALLFPMLSSAVVTNVLAFMTAYVGWNAFETKIPAPVDQVGVVALQGLYFVSSTMATVGYGDIVPQTLLGQAVTILIHVQSLLLVVGMFSALMTFGLANSGQFK